MAIGSASGQGRQLRFVIGAVTRRLSFLLHTSVFYRWRYAGATPERLVIAPIDLRTADPTTAADIFAGRWVFNSEGVDVEGFSVFDAEPPSDAWSRLLHSFGWLRHLRASDVSQSRTQARGLIDEWIRYSNYHDNIAWEPDVVARRVSAWLAQTPLFLEGADYAFYRRFMRSITRQVRYLRRTAYDSTPGLPRLRIMIALAAASLSMSDQSRMAKQIARRLDLELVNQILPDGGHVSRNPAAILEVMIELLPLRQAYTARGLQPSRILVSAIDRMMPMLRFFRQGDGSFGRFNGMGETATDQVATVLAYDDVRGGLPVNAPHSGYQRIDAGTTTVIVDTGRPPPIDYSLDAHAGCLAFEMSVGRERLIVNCGVPRPDAISLRRLARTSAAHSTVSINDTSSCRFLTRSTAGEWFGEAIVTGPTRIDVERGAESDARVLLMRHNGYVGRYGIIHERRLTLSDAGDRLEGVESFLTASGKPVGQNGKDTFAIRFHLHPNVRVDYTSDGRGVTMELPGGERWAFETDELEVEIEESILFSDTRGNRATDQVVIYGRVQQTPSLSWYLHRTALGGGRRRAIAALTDQRAARV
jgi:uncharacterized heparinase superfamily protein